MYPIVPRQFLERLSYLMDLEFLTPQVSQLIVTMPSITYKVLLRNNKEEIIYSPHLFPDDGNIIKVGYRITYYKKDF